MFRIFSCLPFSLSTSSKSNLEFLRERMFVLVISSISPSLFSVSWMLWSAVDSSFIDESSSVFARNPYVQLIVSSHQFNKSSARITTRSEIANTSSYGFNPQQAIYTKSKNRNRNKILKQRLNELYQ